MDVNIFLLKILMVERPDLFEVIYEMAKELKSDLNILFGRNADFRSPEDRFMAKFSVDDDLVSFMKAMKEANCYLKENHNGYLTPYDDFLKKKRGQYTLANQMVDIIDEIRFAEKRKKI